MKRGLLLLPCLIITVVVVLLFSASSSRMPAAASTISLEVQQTSAPLTTLSGHSLNSVPLVVTGTLNTPAFWNGPLRSGVTMASNDQARLLPSLDDEVRLIVQLTDEPLAVYLDQSFSQSGPLNAAEAVAVHAYADRLAESHQQVLVQMEQSGIDVKVNREFSYLVNGLAISTKLSEWPHLKDLPQVKSVQPDYDVHADLSDSVPLIGAPPVWNMVDGSGQHVTGLGIRVAIIDTGIDYTHPDLGNGFGPGHRVIGGYDFVNNDGDPFDDNGHGTHVAGIVAASGVVTGVAPSASLLAYKALDANGSGSYANVIAAVERAVDPDGNPLTNDSANVINMSLSGPGNPDDMLSQAVDQAVAQGVVVVVAAGNSGPNHESMGTPASARRALTVAASDKTDALAGFSSRGPIRDYLGLLKPDITAPGVSIRSTVPTSGQWGSPDRYNTLSGTSMAAPHIAGASALIKQLHPAWTPDMIKANLMNTAKNLGENVYVQGAGRVQVNVAATAPLIAVPGSLSFGRPTLGGATSLPLTLTNVSATVITATASISTVLWDNGTLDGTTIPVQVSYGQLGESNVSIPAGGTHVLAVNLNLPGNAPDGYYVGQIVLRGKNYVLTVPFAFTLLSKVTLHLLDEQGVELTGTDAFMSYLVRVPDADVQKNSWSMLNSDAPMSYYVPSGMYDAFGFARTTICAGFVQGWGNIPQQVPLMLATTLTVPHSSQVDVYLDGRTAHRFTLDATTFAGDPLVIDQYDSGFKYQNGSHPFNARLLYFGGEFFTYQLIAPLPSSFDFYISDTPANVSFDLATVGVGFTPHLRSFEHFSSPTWYDWDYTGMIPGVDFRKWSNEVHMYAWHFPWIDAATPRTLHYDRSEVGRYHVINDLSGTMDPPEAHWFTTGLDFIDYPALGPFPFGIPLSAGVQRDFYVKGAFRYQYWVGNNHLVLHEFYTPDLQPLAPVDDDLHLGSGPLYPALIFDNHPATQTVQMSLPVLGSSHGDTEIRDAGSSSPQLWLYKNGQLVYGGGLDEWNGGWLRSSFSIPIDGAGGYRAILDETNSAQVSNHNTIEAGFTMSPSAADVNPPHVTALDMPQRFVPYQPLTATFTFTDAESGLNALQLRFSTDDGASWMPLTVAQDGARYTAVIDPGDALAVSVGFTVTDQANNYLAYTTIHAAIRETPVVFDVSVASPLVPLQSQPVTVHLNGVLRKIDNQPLSILGFPISVYLNDQFAGYVRDLVRLGDGVFQHGTIDTDFTFIPTDFFTTTGSAKMKFVLDVGTYARQEKVLDLSVATPHLTYLPLVMNNTGLPPTHEQIVNGGFETDDAWQFNSAPEVGSFVTDVMHSGQRSVKLGILPPAPMQYGYGIVSQWTLIPSDATSAKLSFWYWPRREGGSGPLTHSRQFVDVLDGGGNILATLINSSADLPDWQYAEFDLSPYIGRTIKIEFGVYHDGNAVSGKRTAMFVDDVSLTVSYGSRPVRQRE